MAQVFDAKMREIDLAHRAQQQPKPPHQRTGWPHAEVKPRERERRSEKANMNILLVDDEPHILSAYRRSLRRFRHWDCRYESGGEAALGAIAEGQVDVIVTDMRMPGVGGLDVLRSVQLNHPEIVRLVLSGYAEDELLVGTENLAHRYLHKPYPCPDLIELLAELETAIAGLGVRDLRSIVGGGDRLPTPPELFPKLLGGLAQGEFEKVVELIESDVGLATLILRIVNSGFYGVPRVVVSIREATTMLGIRVLNHVVSLWAMGTAMAVAPERVRDLSARGIAVAEAIRAQHPDDHTAISAALVSGAGPMVIEAFGLNDDPDKVAAAFLLLWGGPLSIVCTLDGVRREEPTGSAAVLREARTLVDQSRSQ